MAANKQVTQLAAFFAGSDCGKDTSKNEVSCIAANTHGDVYSVGVHRRIKVYSYRDTLLRSPSRIHFPFIDISSEGRIASLKFAHDNARIVAYGDSVGQVGVMNITSCNPRLKSVLGHTGRISSLGYTSCGRLLVSAGSDLKVKIWNSETLNNMFTFNTQQLVQSICPHPIHPHLLAYITNGTLNCLDLRNPHTHLFEHNSSTIMKCAAYIGESEIVSMGTNEVHLWNTNSLTIARTFKDPTTSNLFTGIDVLSNHIVCGSTNGVCIFNKEWSLPRHCYSLPAVALQSEGDLPPSLKDFLATFDWWKPDKAPSPEYVTVVSWLKEKHVLTAINSGYVYIFKYVE